MSSRKLLITLTHQGPVSKHAVGKGALDGGGVRVPGKARQSGFWTDEDAQPVTEPQKPFHARTTPAPVPLCSPRPGSLLYPQPSGPHSCLQNNLFRKDSVPPGRGGRKLGPAPLGSRRGVRELRSPLSALTRSQRSHCAVSWFIRASLPESLTPGAGAGVAAAAAAAAAIPPQPQPGVGGWVTLPAGRGEGGDSGVDTGLAGSGRAALPGSRRLVLTGAPPSSRARLRAMSGSKRDRRPPSPSLLGIPKTLQQASRVRRCPSCLGCWAFESRALRRWPVAVKQKQANLREFEVNLVYTVNFRPASKTLSQNFN